MTVLTLLLLISGPPDDPRAAELVSGLGAETWSRREWCQAAVERLGQPALPALRRGLRSPDLEIRVRCQRAAEVIDARLFHSLAPARQMPQLDSLWYSPRQRCYDYNHPLHHALGHYVRRRLDQKPRLPGENFEYAPWRLAMHDWCHDLLRAGAPSWSIRLLCAYAWHMEQLAYPSESPAYPWP